MSSSDDDDDAASTARKALKRLRKALAALPPRDEQRNALPPAARASCDVAAAFALCAALHAKHRLAGGWPVHAELQPSVDKSAEMFLAYLACSADARRCLSCRQDAMGLHTLHDS